MFESDFFNKLSDACPVPEPKPENKDSMFDEDLTDGTPAPNSTSNDDLLEKISALENMIAEMKAHNNGSNLQGTSDL